MQRVIYPNLILSVPLDVSIAIHHCSSQFSSLPQQQKILKARHPLLPVQREKERNHFHILPPHPLITLLKANSTAERNH